jgi:hypothetical protein
MLRPGLPVILHLREVSGGLYPPKRGTYLQASRGSKKALHLVMCSRRSSCESSNYTERLGTRHAGGRRNESNGGCRKPRFSNLDVYDRWDHGRDVHGSPQGGAQMIRRILLLKLVSWVVLPPVLALAPTHRTVHTACSGRKDPRSKLTEYRYCSHWLCGAARLYWKTYIDRHEQRNRGANGRLRIVSSLALGISPERARVMLLSASQVFGFAVSHGPHKSDAALPVARGFSSHS